MCADCAYDKSLQGASAAAASYVGDEAKAEKVKEAAHTLEEIGYQIKQIHRYEGSQMEKAANEALKWYNKHLERKEIEAKREEPT